MKKLRLLVTKYCPKSCEGCCNKEWDLNNLPVVDDFSKYDEIIITGGEPLDMMTRQATLHLIDYIYTWYKEKTIILYTATGSGILWLFKQTEVNGITYTIHDESEIDNLYDVVEYFNAEAHWYPRISLRLNVFKGINIPENIDLSLWTIKKDIEWIKNCPLPEDEVFMRMPNI